MTPDQKRILVLERKLTVLTSVVTMLFKQVPPENWNVEDKTLATTGLRLILGDKDNGLIQQ